MDVPEDYPEYLLDGYRLSIQEVEELETEGKLDPAQSYKMMLQNFKGLTEADVPALNLLVTKMKEHKQDPFTLEEHLENDTLGSECVYHALREGIPAKKKAGHSQGIGQKKSLENPATAIFLQTH